MESAQNKKKSKSKNNSGGQSARTASQNGDQPKVVDRITKRPWVEKVTDDYNVWLKAIHLETEGNFEEASSFFLEDAELFKQKGLDARVGLSLLCAGRCKAKLGMKDEAESLYQNAGEYFTSFADKALENSPKDASWGFLKAAECYRYGARKSKAKALSIRSLEIESAGTPLAASIKLKNNRRDLPPPTEISKTEKNNKSRRI